MSASQPDQAVSQRIARGLGDDRQRRRIEPRARHALLGEFPGFPERVRQPNVLVVAMDPVAPAGLAPAEVFVVAPALNSWFRHWLSDETPLAVERTSGWPQSSDSCNEPWCTSRVASATPIPCRQSRTH